MPFLSTDVKSIFNAGSLMNRNKKSFHKKKITQRAAQQREYLLSVLKK